MIPSWAPHLIFAPLQLLSYLFFALKENSPAGLLHVFFSSLDRVIKSIGYWFITWTSLL